jgi:glycosyltransferase involved in cell wall biosynthesis
MRISFVLPGPGDKPIGGFKVVYEYGNHLAARGHSVHIVHTPLLAGKHFRALRQAAIHATRATGMRTWRPTSWFALDARVEASWVRRISDDVLRGSDVVCATAWMTAPLVARHKPAVAKGFYLVQHHETWSGDTAAVDATWRLPLHKIVIATWLWERSAALGQREMTTYVPNGFDQAAFGVDIPIASRPRGSILMMYSDLDWKGSRDGLDAIARVARECPDLRLALYGVPAPPPDLPAYATYHRQPRQAMLRRLYNEAAIFVAPSWTEGFPLPPAEAMMCGCAVAATDIGGHREYAEHGRTALLSPPRDPAALAASITALLDDDLRTSIAVEGRKRIAGFTWEAATDAVEALFCGRASPADATVVTA